MRQLLALGFFLLVVPLVAALAVAVQPFVVATPSRVPLPDAERLRAHVQHLSEALYPRSFDQPLKLAAAAAYIRAAFVTTGAEVRTQEVWVDGERFENVIARFGPKSGSLLVVGAHYDSHGDQREVPADPHAHSRETHTPGADDNASGVAGLLELARLLATNPPRQAVELVAYTLEEPPNFRTEHMGSAWHAKAVRQDAQSVELMISLEMIGYFSDVEGSQTYPLPGMKLFYPSTGDFIALVSRPRDWAPTRRLKAAMAGANDLPVRSINAPPTVPGVDYSDHRSYWAVGIPAIMVTDTAFMRNLEYHRAGDTADRLDYSRMAQAVQGVLAFIHRREIFQERSR